MMTKKIFLLPVLVLFAACTPLTNNAMDDQAMRSDAAHSDDSSQGNSVDRLNDSPRHQEWVEVENNGKTIHTWVVYPETDAPTPVVILIHENKGLNDWARGMADQVAEAGYIAVAPDLLSEFSEQYTRTSDFPSPDDATKAISALKPELVQLDLQAVAEWAKTLPAGNGKLVSAGFCWGGAQSFNFATNYDDLSAAFVFYGTGPTQPAAYANVSAPIFGFYGSADERVNATIAESEKQMKAAGKTYDYEIYDGAGHAFMRSGEDPAGDPANVAARNAAWERMKMILSEL